MGGQYFAPSFYVGPGLFCSTVSRISGPIPTINTERSLISATIKESEALRMSRFFSRSTD